MPKKILLIEDDMATIDVYKTALEKAKFLVEVANLGQEALRIIKEIEEGKAKKPDLVLLDLMLPDMNGMDILKEMRAREKTKDISVFILSNYTDQELQKLGHDLKSEKYLTKTNITPTKLVQIVKEKFKQGKKGKFTEDSPL